MIPGVTGWEKVKAMFSLRNQCMAIEVGINIMYCVLGACDIINFSTTNFCAFGLYIHFASILYVWSLLIILWIHLYNQAETHYNTSLSPPLKVSWVVVTLSGLGLALTALILLILLNTLKDANAKFVDSVLIISLLLLFGLILFFVAVGLIIMSTRILIRMERPQDAKQFSFYLFKRKLGRSIIVFNLAMLPTVFTTFGSAISIVWFDFWTIYPSVAVQPSFQLIISICFSILTTYTLIHEEKLRAFWRCSKESN
jgi:hypothetical protein